MPTSYILGCHDILFQSLHKEESKMILIYTYLHISSTWIADINRHQILPISENCSCSHGNKIQASIWIGNSKWMIIKRRLVLTNALIQLCVPASISNPLSYKPRLSPRQKWSARLSASTDRQSEVGARGCPDIQNTELMTESFNKQNILCFRDLKVLAVTCDM